MFCKKAAAVGLSIFFSMTVLTVPAFAHGHRSGGHHRQAAGSYTATVNSAGTDAARTAGCPAHTGSTSNCLVCAVDGCAETGHHYHDDTVYCGYPHEQGYCDGTCVQAADTVPSSSSAGTWSCRGHHGC